MQRSRPGCNLREYLELRHAAKTVGIVSVVPKFEPGTWRNFLCQKIDEMEC
jgi:hypothetical protein